VLVQYTDGTNPSRDWRGCPGRYYTIETEHVGIQVLDLDRGINCPPVNLLCAVLLVYHLENLLILSPRLALHPNVTVSEI